MQPISRRRKPMSEINVVPYIDVMLVLLVIFMITAPMLTQGVKVDLPETTSEPIELDKNTEPLIISVDVNGAYYLEIDSNRGKPQTLDELKADVEKILGSNTRKVDVLVRGDKEVSYGVVVHLMATLQAAGATNVGLITEMP